MDNQFIDFKALEYAPEFALHLFSRIQHQPWAMLLRSASETHIDSRFDVLVANPIATLETTANSTQVETPSNAYSTQDDPFTLLHQLQEQWLPHVELNKELDLPFVGGALGYFSYDLGRRVETIPEQAEKDLNTPDMAVGLYEWAVVVDHKLKKSMHSRSEHRASLAMVRQARSGAKRRLRSVRRLAVKHDERELRHSL